MASFFFTARFGRAMTRGAGEARPQVEEAAFGGLSDVTQLIFAAVYEEPALVAGWTAESHVERNALMLRNTLEVVDRASPTLRNATILQGPKAYGVHVGRMRLGAREDRDERYEVPNFYWAQENYLKAKQRGRPWSWTVIRPALVGRHSAMPALLTFAALFGGVEAFGLIGLILGPLMMALSFSLLRLFAHDAEAQRV